MQAMEKLTFTARQDKGKIALLVNGSCQLRFNEKPDHSHWQEIERAILQRIQTTNQYTGKPVEVFIDLTPIDNVEG